MGIPIRELQQKISAPDFTGYMAFMSINPHGQERADWRSAMLATVFANCHAKKGKSFKISDFMPKWGQTRKRQKPQDMLAVLSLVTKAKKGEFK